MRKSGSIVIIILALILGFVGGAVTPHFLPIAGITEVEAQIGRLTERMQQVKPAAAPLRIAYIDAENAFAVILDVVAALRGRAAAKQEEIFALQRQRLAGEIAEEDFRHRNNVLNVELLQAQLAINLGAIEKMIVGRGFQMIRSDLESLRDEAQTLEDRISTLLVTTMIGGFADQQEFERQFRVEEAAFRHLDRVLTTVATMKIGRAADEIGREEGFDLVLLQRNVVIYRNPVRILDITTLVRGRLAAYLRPL